jgi:hypothetical protein
MIAFEENWPHLATHFETDLGLPLPAIVNCNPESHYTVFPRRPWREALAASNEWDFEQRATQDDDNSAALTLMAGDRQWPVRDIAALATALDGFRAATSRRDEWIQRQALDPYLDWRIAEWPPHVVALHPSVASLDVHAASWPTLQELRVQGLCTIAGSVQALKLEVADRVVQSLSSDMRSLQESRQTLEGQLDAARQTIADREAASAAQCERIRELFSALAHSRLARLAAESRAHRLRVAVYPAGGHTRELLSATPLSEIPIVGVIDSSPDRWGRAFVGHPVSSPETLDRLRPDVVVICSRSYEDEIYDQLSWLRARGTATLRLYSTDPDTDMPGQFDRRRTPRVA